MSNIYYNPTANPATGSQGLSALMRAEFTLIGTGFDSVARFATIGAYTSTFTHFGNYSFNLPAAGGTLALTTDVSGAVATETAARIAADATLTTNLANEATARALADFFLAPQTSPAFNGIPTAPTAAPGNNTTQLATTAFSAAAVLVETNRATAAEALLAPKASPTLTGVPLAPTAAPGTNTTQLATTAFDTAAVLVETNRATAAEAKSNGRNVIQNGQFGVYQRGVGPFSSGFGPDRWNLNLIVDTSTFQVITLADADRTAIGDETAMTAAQLNVVGAAGATAYSQFQQEIENVRTLAGNTVTVSFWAKAAAAFTLGVRTAQIFGTGGGPSATVNLSAQTFALTTTWTRYTASFAMAALTGKTVGSNSDHALYLGFSLSSGANNAATLGVGVQSGTVSIWGVQLEQGATASTLEKRNIGLEALLCQRFYSVGQLVLSAAGIAGNGFSGVLSLPATMRAAPTLTITGNSNSNLTAFTLTALAGSQIVYGAGTATASTVTSINVSFTASAEL